MVPARPLISMIGVEMIYAIHNSLISRHSLPFPPTPQGAIIHACSWSAATGQGHNVHNAPLLPCCGPVVGKKEAITNSYPPPTTPQRKTPPPSHACTRARVCACKCVFLRCGVVFISYAIEIYRKKGTTRPQHKGQKAVAALWLVLWQSLNPLKNNKKGGFARG